MKKQLRKLFSLLLILTLVTGGLSCAAVAETAEEERIILAEWMDENDFDGLRPESVVMTLGAQNVTLNAENGWRGVLTGAADAAWGVQTVNGYAVSLKEDEDITVATYRHAAQKTAVGVSALWEDMDNAKGVRPDSVKARLLCDGELYGAAVTLNRGNSWAASWEDLPRNRKGTTEKIAWTVDFDTVPEHYAAAVSGSTVTYTLQTGSLTVENSVAGVPEGTDTGKLAVKRPGMPGSRHRPGSC